jgi:hypothetical protein
MNLKASVITAAARGLVGSLGAQLYGTFLCGARHYGVLFCGALFSGGLLAAPAPTADAAPPAREATTAAGEPAVKRTVIEDGGSKVEELRVRGQTQRITVTPKVGGMRPYEIIGADGSRDLQEAPDATRGASGKRVWHVLSF